MGSRQHSCALPHSLTSSLSSQPPPSISRCINDIWPSFLTVFFFFSFSPTRKLQQLCDAVGVPHLLSFIFINLMYFVVFFCATQRKLLAPAPCPLAPLLALTRQCVALFWLSNRFSWRSLLPVPVPVPVTVSFPFPFAFPLPFAFPGGKLKFKALLNSPGQHFRHN